MTGRRKTNTATRAKRVEKRTRFDAADYLKSEKAMTGYLKACFEDGDPALIAAALGDIGRARLGMVRLSKHTGLSREGLYRSLNKNGNPSLDTVTKVVRALGLKMTLSDAARAQTTTGSR
jgi:probable addiction module antidote protein